MTPARAALGQVLHKSRAQGIEDLGRVRVLRTCASGGMSSGMGRPEDGKGCASMNVGQHDGHLPRNRDERIRLHTSKIPYPNHGASLDGGRSALHGTG